ncbi:uncharacterized protein LOC135708122 [Ochlerotatus camptorhynchus]|uniref:uncharacterized protein LOC135708122 n=1 Tax=Ochlerotatus camptorhynchus TaxID=644619 RepID=UPI0031DEC100
MSSLMDKSKLPVLESRSKMFLRSNSFQKLCSLAHPMRLKGFKSNREALKSVFESLIVTTRGVFQSVTYRILCFLFLTPFSKLVSAPLAAAVSTGKDGRLSTVRLILKLTLSMIVSTEKAEVECDKGRFVHSAVDEISEQPAKCVDTAVQTEPPKATEPREIVEQFFDCKEDSNVTPSKPSSQELLLRLLESSPPSDSSSSSSSRSRSKQLSLQVIVYGCVLYCFAQLSVLAYLLNVATRIPPGLVFLISSVAYIGYVMMRIVFNQCSPKGTDLVSTKPPSMTVALVKVTRKAPTQPKGIHPLLAAVSKQVASVMQSRKMMMMMVPVTSPGSTRTSRCDMVPRSRSRTAVPPMLDNKTISKVKLF